MSDTIKISKTLYTTGLSTVAERWFKGTGPLDVRGVGPEIARERLAAAEALMIAPRVVFHVWGENVVLPLLTATFGPENVADLLKDHSIKFYLYSPSLGTTEDREVLRQGVSPLQ